MTKEQLSQIMFNSCNNMHSKATELYERLHDDNMGDPCTEIDGKLDAFMKMAVHAIRVEFDTIRTAIDEYND